MVHITEVSEVVTKNACWNTFNDGRGDGRAAAGGVTALELDQG